MKKSVQTFSKIVTACMQAGLLFLFMLVFIPGRSQTLTNDFVAAGYTLTDLGSIDQLPAQNGGLTIRPDQPNTLYIGGSANNSGGGLYTVALTRDPVTNHITGFGGAATLFTEAPNNDGGILFDQNGTLLFTRYSMNELGQKLTNNTYTTTSLTEYGVASSVGALALVPDGYPGAGGLVFSSYNTGILYNVPYTVDAAGQYFLSNKIAEVTVYPEAAGPEGIAYIPAGSAAFPNLSMAISSYGTGTVLVYEVGEYGLPVTLTARQMVIGLSGAEGAWIDPVTGDFLFSTFGGGNKVIRISGFEIPTAIREDITGTGSGFSIYPNPSEGYCKLNFTKPVSKGLVTVFTTQGGKVMEQEFSTSTFHELNLAALPSGSYFIRVKTENSAAYQKLILR